MMSTGTPEELKEREQKARLLLEQIAVCLNELDEIAPGSVVVAQGRVGGFGASVVRRRQWEVDSRF
jgi:hypothetical protein